MIIVEKKSLYSSFKIAYLSSFTVKHAIFVVIPNRKAIMLRIGVESRAAVSKKKKEKIKKITSSKAASTQNYNLYHFLLVMNILPARQFVHLKTKKNSINLKKQILRSKYCSNSILLFKVKFLVRCRIQHFVKGRQQGLNLKRIHRHNHSDDQPSG